MKRSVTVALGAAFVLAAIVVAVAWPRAQMLPSRSPDDWAATPANVQRGAYLARVGDCAACHTARGGTEYAGGRAIETPFGRLYAPNITSDRTHGLGNWSADDFWNALHNGRSRDGHLLYPAFPYPNYTRVSRVDSDALYAYLRSVPPSAVANRPHELQFPYDRQVALMGWRLLYFRPAVYQMAPGRGALWNRGAYLVEGLGHCGACHSARNGVGASAPGLEGGLIPVLGWYAPSLASDREAGLGDWTTDHIVQLLRTGVSPRATVVGPMAEVVQASLQYVSPDDMQAMAVYLKSLPASASASVNAEPRAVPEAVLKQGKQVYGDHCVDCHGTDGRGLPPHYPPLAGNAALTMANPVNAIRVVLNGGFAPGTAGNPRPYGMLPFSHVLTDEEVAAVLSYARTSWGNRGGLVQAHQVNAYRTVPLD